MIWASLMWCRTSWHLFSIFCYGIIWNLNHWTETEVNIYTGKKISASEVGEFKMSQLRLIQRFPDEFSSDNYRNLVEENGHSAVGSRDGSGDQQWLYRRTSSGFRRAVQYKVDRIFQAVIRYSRVKYTFPERGQRLVYGCIRRRGETLQWPGKRFPEFVKEDFRLYKLQ